MENFMERLYRENSPENKEIERKQYIENRIRSYASGVSYEIQTLIKHCWDKHLVEGYITYYCFDGDNYGFRKELIRKSEDPLSSLSKRVYTYSEYLLVKSEDEANSFINQLKEELEALGIRDFSIRKELVSVESYNPNSFLKAKTKEYDAYAFHIKIKW